MTSNASQQYLRNAILTATPEQLQLMLYDGAIRFAQAGREGLERRDYEASFNGFERAQRIVLQLIAGLNREVSPRIVDEMTSLYHFVYDRLVDANARHNLSSADDALRILRHQRETWRLLLDKLASERAAAEPPAEFPRLATVAGD